MTLYSLRTKVMALVGGGLLLATVGIISLAQHGMQKMIDRNQTAIYQGQLDHMLLLLLMFIV